MSEVAEVDVGAELERKTAGQLRDAIAHYRSGLMSRHEFAGRVRAMWHCTAGLVSDALCEALTDILQELDAPKSGKIQSLHSVMIAKDGDNYNVTRQIPGTPVIEEVYIGTTGILSSKRTKASPEPGFNSAQMARQSFNEKWTKAKQSGALVWSFD